MKKILKQLISLEFKIEVTNKFIETGFLDITFSLANGKFWP